MAQQTIVTYPAVAKDSKLGTPIADAFKMVNDNFDEVYGKPDLSLAANILTLTKADGTTDTVDLSPYLDEDARAIASGTIDGAGIVTFTRDDASTFTLDLSSLLDDTNLARITSGSVAGSTLTLTRNDATTIDIDVSTLLGDITSIAAGDGLTGDTTSGDATLNVVGGDGITANADEIEVTVDDSTIELSASDGTGAVRIKDDGVTYAKMGAEFTTAAVISASDVDFSSAQVFTKTLTGLTALTFSNVQTGMVKDLVITGEETLTLPDSVKTITGTYDGTVSNLIQIVSTNGATEQWASISQEA